MINNMPANAGDARDVGLIPGLERSPEEETTDSSILDWRIPWTQEPGRLPWGGKALETTEHTYRRFSWDRIYMIMYKENSGMEYLTGGDFNFM